MHHNLVVDSASIEINRRRRRRKTDRIAVLKLLSMLMRYDNGEGQVWSFGTHGIALCGVARNCCGSTTSS